MSDRAKELAAAFDRAFAEPFTIDEDARTLALHIRVGETAYLLRLADVTLVGRAPRIVPLPSDRGSASQLGIAGIRGKLVTVFSLGALLGEPSTAPKWIALAGDVAIAFDTLDGQTELAAGEAPPNLLDLAALLAGVRENGVRENGVGG